MSRNFILKLTFGLADVIFLVTQELLFFFADCQVQRVLIVVVTCLNVVIGFDFVFVVVDLCFGRSFFFLQYQSRVMSLLSQLMTHLKSLTSFSTSPTISTSSKHSWSNSSLIMSSSSSMLLLFGFSVCFFSAAGSSSWISAGFSCSFVAFTGDCDSDFPGLPFAKLISKRYSSGSWPSSRSAYGEKIFQHHFEEEIYSAEFMQINWFRLVYLIDEMLNIRRDARVFAF